MPSKSSEIAIALGFHSFCVHRHENNIFWQTLKLPIFQLLVNNFWWGCFWWRQLLIFRTSFLQMLPCNSSSLFVQSIALICSSEPMLHLKTLKFLTMVMHTWTNITISNWLELEVAMEIDEDFRVLRFWFWKRRDFQRYSLKSESVGSAVRSVCLCLCVFSKNDCNSEGDKQTQH